MVMSDMAKGLTARRGMRRSRNASSDRQGTVGLGNFARREGRGESLMVDELSWSFGDPRCRRVLSRLLRVGYGVDGESRRRDARARYSVAWLRDGLRGRDRLRARVRSSLGHGGQLALATRESALLRAAIRPRLPRALDAVRVVSARTGVVNV